MEDKYKHMDYIQSAITRMASNSFYLKGWSITIVAAIVALSINESGLRIYFCALVLTIIFWFLDSYYLQKEELFRLLYKDVSAATKDAKIDFSMDTRSYEDEVPSIPKIMFWNISVTPLYLSISIMLIVLISFSIGV